MNVDITGVRGQCESLAKINIQKRAAASRKKSRVFTPPLKNYFSIFISSKSQVLAWGG